MNFFNNHKTVIFRTLGALMLVIGFAAHFWTTPKEVLTQNERAAANIARMEAKVAGGSSSAKQSAKKDDAKFMSKMKDTQAKQLRFLTIIAMILGVGFLGYSFVKPKRDSAQ